ncbi:MAG: hypothetical protein AAF621_04840 [Pseudomonadota bacterium]
MSEYDFEPDYAYWWNKGTLSYEELCWLICGLNPDWGRRKTITRDGDNYDEEKEIQTYRAEAKWRNALEHYMYGLSFLGAEYTSDQYNLLRQYVPYSGCKAEFIRRARKMRFSLPRKFEALLEAQGVLDNEEAVAHYRNHNRFLFDFKTLNLKEIQTEQDAFAILMKLQPEALRRYASLHQMTLHADYENIYSVFHTEDDLSFYIEYQHFLRDFYYDGYIDPLSLGEEVHLLDLWNGDFKDYAQSLYNNGFIFRYDVMRMLAEHDIPLTYHPESWPYNLYTFWKEKQAWTFHEALALFKGECPDRQFKFYDFRQHPWILNVQTASIWNIRQKKRIGLEDILQRHIAVTNQLEEFHYRDKVFYKPEQIVCWFLEQTSHLPPDPLMKIILGPERFKQYYRDLSLRMEENENVMQQIRNMRDQSETLEKPQTRQLLIKCAMPFWDDYLRKEGTEPDISDVTNYLIRENPHLLTFKNRRRSSLDIALTPRALQNEYENYTRLKKAG